MEGLKREFGRLLESELATGWHERQHTLAAVRLRGLRDRLVALTTDLAAAATAEQDGEAAAAAAGLQRAKSGGGGGLEARLACEDVLCLAEDGLAQLLAELEADPGLRAAREAYTKSMRREHQLLTARVARVIRKDTEAEGRQAVADAQRRLARARASGLECGHMTVLQLGAELKERESGLRSQIAEARCGAPAAVSAFDAPVCMAMAWVGLGLFTCAVRFLVAKLRKRRGRCRSAADAARAQAADADAALRAHTYEQMAEAVAAEQHAQQLRDQVKGRAAVVRSTQADVHAVKERLASLRRQIQRTQARCAHTLQPWRRRHPTSRPDRFARFCSW